LTPLASKEDPNISYHQLTDEKGNYRLSDCKKDTFLKDTASHSNNQEYRINNTSRGHSSDQHTIKNISINDTVDRKNITTSFTSNFETKVQRTEEKINKPT
jgi:hypothetical protein